MIFKSKKVSVSHAKHWLIREIREIRVLKKNNIRVLKKYSCYSCYSCSKKIVSFVFKYFIRVQKKSFLSCSNDVVMMFIT